MFRILDDRKRLDELTVLKTGEILDEQPPLDDPSGGNELSAVSMSPSTSLSEVSLKFSDDAPFSDPSGLASASSTFIETGTRGCQPEGTNITENCYDQRAVASFENNQMAQTEKSLSQAESEIIDFNPKKGSQNLTMVDEVDEEPTMTADYNISEPYLASKIQSFRLFESLREPADDVGRACCSIF